VGVNLRKTENGTDILSYKKGEPETAEVSYVTI
jgi:hypothetical protein